MSGDTPDDIRQYQATLRGMIAFRESRGWSRMPTIRAREERELRALRWAVVEAGRQVESKFLPPDEWRFFVDDPAGMRNDGS